MRRSWGSLINPRVAENELLESTFHELQPLLEKALAKEAKDDTAHEMAVTARGVAKAAEILASQFTLVATNVPYLGRGKQDDELKEYCDKYHNDAKGDLATCFLERCLVFAAMNGTASLVTPEAWLYLDKFKKIREQLLAVVSWNQIIIIGEHGFQSPQAAGAFAAFASLSRKTPNNATSFLGIDVSKLNSPDEKAFGLSVEECRLVPQLAQAKNPDTRISFGESGGGKLLGTFAQGLHGQGSFDDPCFVCSFWERDSLGDGWVFQQTTGTSKTCYSGLTNIFRWENGQGMLARLMDAKASEGYTTGKWRAGIQAWGKPGIVVGGMRRFFINVYSGQSFDTNVAVILPHDASLVPALWHFVTSDQFHDAVRALDRKLKVTCNTFVKVQFDEDQWRAVAKAAGAMPKPFSSDPTQWLFNGHPAVADQPLHVAVARLLGYQWPRQTGSSFPDCPALKADSLDKLADKDGIVCLSATKGEAPAADRLNALLAAAYGSEWSSTKARELLAATDSDATTLADWLSDDFFEQHCDLFHQRPFIWHIWDGLKGGFSALVNYHRLAAAEGAGKRTLDKLIYTYLGEWIDAQRKAQKAGVEGADARLTAAEHLSAQLKAILAGEPPFDLFVRWKPLHEQPIGWNPDINDGVRLNLRPFMAARPLSRRELEEHLARNSPDAVIIGKKLLRARVQSTCILRVTPKVSWDKDRGKEPQRAKVDFPWFWTWDKVTADFKGGSTFDGNRWNDCHFSTATKQAARDRHKNTK